MRDLLAIGSRHLNRVMARHVASAVEYRRGASSISVRATRGLSETAIIDSEGSAAQHRAVDWIVPAEDLVMGGVRFDPSTTDRLVVIAGGVEQHFTVTEIPSGPCWRYTDGYCNRVRIHTKAISAT